MPFSADRLIADFGGKAPPTRQAVRALADAIESGAGSESLGPWTALFRKTCGRDWPPTRDPQADRCRAAAPAAGAPKARLDRLAAHYGAAFDPSRPETVLFALQTWYVLLVKLLLAHGLAAIRGREPAAAKFLKGDACHAVGALMGGEMFAALAVTDPWAGAPFDWCVEAWSEALEQAAIDAAARVAAYGPADIIAAAASGCDLLKPLYESLFPRAVRHALGEYYTPGWLVEHVLDQLGYRGQHDARVLDPTCGSGAFLLAALRRWRVASKKEKPGESERGRLELPNSARLPGFPLVVGFDLHPLAVATARANYLLAIADILPDCFVDVPVFARDAVLDEWPPSGKGTVPFLRPCDSQADATPCPQKSGQSPAEFDFVVGNPPWIAWDNLPTDYREATKPLWQRYGLFSLSGNAARHGGGKKDLSMLVLYAAADRYLRTGGRLGMVITQTLFQSKGAGDGFRRFRLGADGPPLRVLRVDDLVDVRPFDDAANWTSVIALQKGEPTTYPVPYVKWQPCETGARLPAAMKLDLAARPVDPDRPTSPWAIQTRSASEADSRESSLAHRASICRADYTAHLGANSGGANAVYWLDVLGKEYDAVRVRNRTAKAKRTVQGVEAVIEPDLLYPLVRWKDVDRWFARPSAYLLLVQDPTTRAGIHPERMRRDYPRTLDYLRQFEPLLGARAAYRRYQDRQPFYSMYNVGPYTLAAAKVIWRRMDRKIRAAVVETIDDPLLGRRPVVPQETCVLIACESGDEAHYLCALLNSSIVHDLVTSHSVAGGKGFGTPSILDYVPLRTFDPADKRHSELAQLSRRLHQTPANANSAGDLEAVERLVAHVLGREI